ncbi:MAG: UDP-N-acetylmuramoyl-tripeptide--D-alanyl-D-alanine ligase [Desulfotomaculaceae bacterium]|nr:UDP-N-acetylmuramoyl-tripeptide--D-alanyl-D-alanine ligase [Desulfotomaculaceae bacterium]
MISISTREIASVVRGRVLQGDPAAVFSSIATDTRKMKVNALFFALVGEQYDAHSFLPQAVAAGAGGLVVSRLENLPTGVPVIMVENTLAALQSLAAYNRQRSGAVLVGVTGSTGKTTTKDMIASVLRVHLHTLKSEGNFNNEIGLPLTLLELDESHEAAAVEMGMRGPGEIQSLCEIARPKGAVITNINETHLELLGTVSNIAEAKGEILEHIPSGGFAILNAESPFIRREARRCRGKVIYYGIEQPAEIRGENILAEGMGSRFNVDIDGQTHAFYLPVPGRHNVMNALAAIGVGLEMGLTVEEITSGLATVALTGMRLEVIEGGSLKIINDAYNASPASTRAALGVLKDLAGGRRSIAVLGTMLELGARAQGGHREVGKTAATLGLDYLITVGELAGHIVEGAVDAGFSPEKVFRCAEHDSAVKILEGLLQEGDVVLVKGSRSMKMERFIQYLLKRSQLLSRTGDPTITDN